MTVAVVNAVSVTMRFVADIKEVVRSEGGVLTSRVGVSYDVSKLYIIT